MDRQAKKLQSVREEGRYEDMDQFIDAPDSAAEADKEVSLGQYYQHRILMSRVIK